MEFLKHAALPQSPEHFQLIVFIAAIASMVLIPYLAMLTGTSLLSVLIDLKGKKIQKSSFHVRILFEKLTGSITTILFLGILPALTVVFVYAQILQTTNSISVSLAGFGFLFLVAGFILLYAYGKTLRLGGILDAYAEVMSENNPPGIEQFRAGNRSVKQRSGIYGALFLLIAASLFISAYGLAVDRVLWNEVETFFGALISASIWMRLFLFAALCAGATGFGMLYFSESAGQPSDEEPDSGILPKRIVIISMLVMPTLMLLIIVTQPLSAMSGAVYFLTGFSGFLFFISGHFLYGHHTRRKSEAMRIGFYVFLAAAIVSIANDHIVLSNATKQEAAVLAVAHDRATEELRSRLGITRVSMTGEDIFNAKCSACHLYDQKKVGPAYNDVVPKYGSDKAKLVAFVLNPQKINPEYPPMPAQGLRPAEADSVVTYILSKISGNPDK